MSKSIGVWRSWALVVGSMIGSGIFTLPAILAPYGSYSFVGWLVTAIGAIFIVLSFCQLTRRSPKAGGPYAYVYEAFGKRAAQIVAYGYWISLWSGVAAIAISFSGYMAFFFPIAAENNLIGAFFSLGAVAVFSYVNIRGIEEASIVQLVTVILKMIPLIFIGSAGLYYGNITEIPAINPNDEPFPIMISGICLLIMWSYIGVEAATVPVNDTENPKKTIPRALIIGVLTTTAVYVVSIAGVMAMISPLDLQRSVSPFSDAAQLIFGQSGALIVTIGALIAIGGALNSMILLSGIVPLAGAEDGVFPAIFKRKDKNGTPVISIIFSSLLAGIIIFMNASRGLLGAFEFMILLSTFTILIAYLGAALASIKLQYMDTEKGIKINYSDLLISILATIFSIIAIIGAWVIYN